MTPHDDQFELAVPAGALIALDASATLAYLAGDEAVRGVAAWIFDGCLASGRNGGLLSTLTAAELLVRPFRAGDASVANVEAFLRFFGSIRLAEVTYPVARTAARLRAATGISMPDAIVIGTAVELGADIIATNDRGWPASLAAAIGPMRIVQLGDFAG